MSKRDGRSNPNFSLGPSSMTAKAKHWRRVPEVAAFLSCLGLAAFFEPKAMLIWLIIGLIAFCGLMLWGARGQKKMGSKGAEFVNKLEIDEDQLRYSQFADRTETICWNEIRKVDYFFGEPDYPDPWAGFAPEMEWRFHGQRGLLGVPHTHSEQLATWCVRKLPGFRSNLVGEALSSKEYGTWILWER